MKRIFWIVLGAALAGSGCVPTTFQRQEETRPVPPPPKPPAPPPPPVSAETITEANARDKANAMARELNYALGRTTPASAGQ